MSFGRRVELTRLVRELGARMEFCEAGSELTDKLEARLLSAEIDAASDELDGAVRAFLALALVDVGREREAVAHALIALSKYLPRYNRRSHALSSTSCRKESPRSFRSKPAIFCALGFLLREIAMFEHSCHFHDTLQLNLSPMPARR